LQKAGQTLIWPRNCASASMPNLNMLSEGGLAAASTT
jgi:hypothetical protein